MLPSHCIAGPAPPQKICSKGTGIKNKKSAVITVFEMTIIKITYNLRFKRCLIHFISILTESLWWQHSFISHSSLDKHTCVSSVPVTSRQESVTSVIYLLNAAFTCWGVTSRQESVTSVIYLPNAAFTCWGVTSDKSQSPLWFICSMLHLHVEE